MGEKTCIKCGLKGDEKLFRKNANLCKDCHKTYMKHYHEVHKNEIKSDYNPDEIKTCTVCGLSGKSSELFRQGRDQCKKCEYKSTKNWRTQNPEKIKEILRNQSKRRYKNNLAKEMARQRKYREANPDYSKKYYAKNPEKVLKSNKKYRNTAKGKITLQKQNAKRRNLGHEPINMWFKGSEAHHLRYSRNIKEQDNDITLYVPRKLHRSIHHNGNTGKGMRDINIACLEWYLEITPEEEQNPKATKLYNNYLTLPEPQW